MKKFLALALVAGMAVCIAGCNSNGSSESNESKESGTDTVESDKKEVSNDTDKSQDSQISKDAVKIEDIDWSVEGTVIDGERLVAFSYVNNSPYSILEIEMEFTQREDLTDEEKNVLNEYVAGNDDFDESDIDDLYLSATLTGVVEPGEESKDTTMDIDGRPSCYISDMSLYDIMEPDMMSICFITDNDTLYETYYDFKNDAYGESSEGEIPAHEWAEGDLGSLIPIPDAPVVVLEYETDSYFDFDAFGVTGEDFSAYVEECKNAGFTEISFDEDDWFEADNEAGDNVDLDYYDQEGMIYGTVRSGTN